MNAKECRAVRREIDNSELGQRLSETVENHLLACAACAQFRVERGQLRELVGSLKPVTAPADFDMRLRARIAREREQSARQPFIFRVALTTPAIAIAALLVIAFAALIWINQSHRNPQTASVEPNQGQTNSSSKEPVKVPDGNREALPPAIVKNTPAPEPKRLNPQSTKVKAARPDNSLAQASDSASRRAVSIPMRSNRDGEVSLTAPSKPMVVTVQDADGSRHRILLPPVSFGSQRFDNRTSVSMTNRRDW